MKEIDSYIPHILNSLNDDDLLIITGDHGCDPTVEGTDTQEKMFQLLFIIKTKNLKI
ncbi:MAG: hypothetical protein L6V95_15415 [Candidatus Melainabacteria bacterium]|nr:MAG: hypothetical protein L6V95_15415 [Candidatus Melainabacteria bacterium]